MMRDVGERNQPSVPSGRLLFAAAQVLWRLDRVCSRVLIAIMHVASSMIFHQVPVLQPCHA